MNKDKRPVNLSRNIVINQPLTAIASILHRIAGILLFFGMFIMLWALDIALTSPEGFDKVALAIKTNFFVKFVIWALLTALIYHWIAGLKHLIMDLGIGVTIKGVWFYSILALILGISLSILVGVWIW